MSSELTKLREQARVQRQSIRDLRALLRRAHTYVGVAAGVYAAAQPDKERLSYPWRDVAIDALQCASDINEMLTTD